MLPHLHNGWQVDQSILSEEDRVVVIRFGHDWDPTCMKMDEVNSKLSFFQIDSMASSTLTMLIVDIVCHCGKGEKLCRGLLGGYLRSVRLQQDVRVIRSLHLHVFLPKQAHHDRSGDG